MLERNGYPVAALVLGVVMGSMVEQSFVTSLIKSDGSIWPFFSRPVSMILASFTIGALLWPLGFWLWGLAAALRRGRPGLGYSPGASAPAGTGSSRAGRRTRNQAA